VLQNVSQMARWVGGSSGSRSPLARDAIAFVSVVGHAGDVVSASWAEHDVKYLSLVVLEPVVVPAWRFRSAKSEDAVSSIPRFVGLTQPMTEWRFRAPHPRRGAKSVARF
jgi:hypothetical protein